MKDYIKPRSITFWAGLLSVLAGVALGIHDAQPIGWFGDALRGWVGDVGPHTLIANGAGLIGLRRAIEANA